MADNGKSLFSVGRGTGPSKGKFVYLSDALQQKRGGPKYLKRKKKGA